MKKAPKVLTRMRLSCCWGDNLDVKELKKQVEEYENEPLTNKISRIDCVVSKIYSQNKIQQKEFINYLESEIDRLEKTEFYIDSIQKAAIETHKHNLSKYKEIIGISNENNMEKSK